MLFSVFTTFVISVVFVLSHSRQVCGQSSDICDWVGSGLSQGPAPGVQPLYLRCTQGRVRWHYPRGALRALLRPGSSSFRGCVRVTANSTGARLFLEGERRLFPLFRPGDGQPQELRRCFSSRHGQAALYVEADPPLHPLRKDTVEFRYDLEPQRDLADDMEECQPCSDKEILKSFCTSDFVVQGTVSSLSHNEAAQLSELSVRVRSLRKDSPEKPWSGAKYVTLHRPLKCGTKAGVGEFLFFGRWSLGQPIIRCAPRLSHWKEVRRKALAAGTNECQL